MDPRECSCLSEEYASVETTTNAQLATVKHVEKAAAPPAPFPPSVPRAVSAKEAPTSAAAATEMQPLC